MPIAQLRPPMRLLVHDLCGHPFQLQLSKELARRGHQLLHVFSEDFTTGKGDLSVPSDLTERMAIVAASSGRQFAKYRVGARVLSETQYGRALGSIARDFQPDIALTANDPLISKLMLGRALRDCQAKWAIWEQDLIYKAVPKMKLGGLPIGRVLGLIARKMEGAALRMADHTICITPDFVEEITALGVSSSSLSVIENWAPLDEISPLEQPTAWQLENGFQDNQVLLYAGTLGLKHDPELLASLAEAMQAEAPDVRVVVVSEGLGAEYLRAQIGRRGMENLVVLDFQPYDRMGEVLGAATALIVLLEQDAGPMSVPSKALTYLTAGRPILASLPPENAAYRQLEATGAAYLSEAGSTADFIGAASKLLRNERLEEQGQEARRYAERQFDIKSIGDRFEALLLGVRSGQQPQQLGNSVHGK